jgi:hypothetical protein
VRRAWLALVVLAGCATARPPQVPVDTTPSVEALTPDTAPIGLRRSVVADEYFWLRTKVLEGEAPPAFAEGLAAMRELRADLGADASAWEDLEVPLGSASGASELVGIYGALPEQTEVNGKTIALREIALRVARAL